MSARARPGAAGEAAGERGRALDAEEEAAARAVRAAAARGDAVEVSRQARRIARVERRRLLGLLGPRLLPLLLAQAAWWPILAMAGGLALPPLAGAARLGLDGWLATAVVASVLALPRERGWEGGAARAALAGLLAVPLAWGLAVLLGASPGLCAAVALAAAAPVATGTLGYAAALGLPGVAGPLLLTSLLAPAALPAAAALFGAGGFAGAEDLAARLLAVAGLPALLALALRNSLAPDDASRRGWAALAVGCVALQALARMDGAWAAALAAPGALPLLGLLALVPPLCGVLALRLLSPGLPAASLVLVGSFRNVTLAWGAAAPMLGPAENLFFALAALPAFSAPLLAARLARA